MSGLGLYLFHDRVAAAWAPFSDTRPVGELVTGIHTLRARAETATGLPCLGHLAGDALAGFDEPGAAPGVRAADVDVDAHRVLLLGRVALRRTPDLAVETPTRLLLDGRCVGWCLPPGAPVPEEYLGAPEDAAAGPSLAVEGSLLSGPWDLVAQNPDWLRHDMEGSLDSGVGSAEGAIRIGSGPVTLDEGASVEAGVVLDTTGGPIHLGRNVRVEGPARLVGPLHVGRGSSILGGVVASSSIGPVCKVRGEVADCVFLGWANKAHDGHLGHAVVGRWVNLGAGTTNSDLKNNYGPVRVWTPGGEVDTGHMKVGCFLGDHAKTAIGTLINTGTVVGAGSNLFGGMPPRRVRPFAWGSAADAPAFRLEDFLTVADRAMARRGEAMTPGVRGVLERLWTTDRGR